MKTTLVTFLLSCAGMLMAQTADAPRFAKYDVASTGCKVYLPGDPGEFEKTLSEDKSEVYTAEVTNGDYNFAVIVVKFAKALEDDKESQVDMLTNYLDFLQGQFEITGAAGYGKGHTLESHPAASGVIDYWEDTAGTQYAIKGWVDARIMAVLILYGPEEYPNFNIQEMFLNGFRFPEK